MSSGLDWPEWKPETTTSSDGRIVDWVAYVLARPMAAMPAPPSTTTRAAPRCCRRRGARCGQARSRVRPRELFDPIGMAEWSAGDPNGVSTGGYGIRMSTRDAARFAYLFPQQGVWDGLQVVSRGGPMGSRSRPASNRDGHRCSAVLRAPTCGLSHRRFDSRAASTFFAMGYGGAYLFVVPAIDLVRSSPADLPGESSFPPMQWLEEFCDPFGEVERGNRWKPARTYVTAPGLDDQERRGNDRHRGAHFLAAGRLDWSWMGVRGDQGINIVGMLVVIGSVIPAPRGTFGSAAEHPSRGTPPRCLSWQYSPLLIVLAAALDSGLAGLRPGHRISLAMLVPLLAGWFVMYRVMLANRFSRPRSASRTTAVTRWSAPPYRLVRHPGDMPRDRHLRHPALMSAPCAVSYVGRFSRSSSTDGRSRTAPSAGSCPATRSTAQGRRYRLCRGSGRRPALRQAAPCQLADS